MQKFKNIIRYAIIALPYVVHVLKILIEILDITFQEGAKLAITKLNLNQQTTNEKPLI